MQPKKSPKRVAAGKRNRAKRGPISQIGKAKLRLAIRRVQPWKHSTGPKTPEGKSKSALNGLARVKNGQNMRKLRREMFRMNELLSEMRKMRDSNC